MHPRSLPFGSADVMSSSGMVKRKATLNTVPSMMRKIQRLRLTLRPGDPSSEEFEGHTTSTGPDSSDSGTPAFSSPQQHDGKLASDPYRRRNGYVQPGGPVGTEDTDQHTAPAVNGLMEKPSQRSAVVGGGVPGADTDTQQGVMAHEWTVSHLRDEMNYIRAVRDSLEKVRERMYGQFGGMQQSMQKMSQDIKAANAQRQDLEAQVRVRTTAMESLDQMNSSLLSDNISLQKSLLENCLDRVEKQDEMKTMRSTCRQAETKLWERERELASARAENQALRLQIESSQEASSQALQEMSERLQRGHDERLQEEQRRHREEIEALQAQIDNYVKRLEEAEMKVRTAEAKIAEKDKRISEVERLLDCMGQEKSHLLVKLQDCEQRLHILEQETDRVDETVFNKSQKLEDEAAELRERIKHLNDMVFCQQRKVKAMIEEVEILRATVAEKDLFITELLDRIAAAESKNNAKRVETKDVGVGCDLPVRKFVQSLPDKGKKIIDFVQRLRLAVANDEEEEKRQHLLSAVKTEFQSKYQQALVQRQPGNHETESGPELSETSSEIMGHGDMDSPIVPLGACVQDSAGSNGLKGSLDSTARDVVGMETCDRESGSLEGVKEDITEAFESVTLSEETTDPSLSKARLCDRVPDNPFWGQRPQKKPHCVEIVEKTEINEFSRKAKFKPNQPLLKANGSPSGSSPSAESLGDVSPLSIEARRQRDRKHLDDITAAKQRPLHHSPAQLLNLAESVSLLQEQTRKYEELQAKVAAQKLAERLSVGTEPYGLEVRVLRGYREVRDIGDDLPSDED
ncbi:uncharacterized protein [Paramormyrops kingsleyae]|uniref:uncharacterized protein isoform X2 n=1 Tax=Paramormyrops kingsleyae TaxID=1676925 RepID=UPI003B96C7A2